MTAKNGSVAPKERINIRYVPATGDQQEEVELPLKLLVIGDFKGHEEETAVEKRQVVRIDKNNFDNVLAESNLTLKMDVPAMLDEGDGRDSLHVSLKFRGLKDFFPDTIARQVPELNKLLELREALVALKGPMGNIPAFRKQIQAVLGDDSARGQLAKELEQLLESSEP